MTRDDYGFCMNNIMVLKNEEIDINIRLKAVEAILFSLLDNVKVDKTKECSYDSIDDGNSRKE